MWWEENAYFLSFLPCVCVCEAAPPHFSHGEKNLWREGEGGGPTTYYTYFSLPFFFGGRGRKKKGKFGNGRLFSLRSPSLSNEVVGKSNFFLPPLWLQRLAGML